MVRAMWETTGDVRAFLEAAGEHMRADPAEHTALLTISEMVARRGPHAYGDEAPQFGWWRAEGRIDGTFLHTPPHPVLLGPGSPAAARALAGAVADRPLLAGLNGPTELVELAREGFGRPATVRRRECLHRLGEIIDPPSPPPGRAIVAGSEHRPRLIEFYGAFAQFAGEPTQDWTPMVDDRLSHDGLHLWLTPEGEPVCMAGVTRQLAGMMRIAPVYTPPEHRRNGYAGALTAAVSHRARDAGASEVLLFTDLANPTANGVYRRVGYVPVSERLSVTFSGSG
jgi:GNAT superfamily N-acetyltransferase